MKIAKLLFLPSAMLGAPQIPPNQAPAADHHAVENFIKARILLWRLGDFRTRREQASDLRTCGARTKSKAGINYRSTLGFST